MDRIIFGDIFDAPRAGFGVIVEIGGVVRNARYVGERGFASVFEFADGSIGLIHWD